MKMTKRILALLLALVMVFALGISASAEAAEEEAEEETAAYGDTAELVTNWGIWEITEFDPNAFSEAEEDFEEEEPEDEEALPEDKKLYELFINDDIEDNTALSILEDNTFELFILSDLFKGTWEDDGTKLVLTFDGDEEADEFYLEYHIDERVYLCDSGRTWQMRMYNSYQTAADAYDWEYYWDDEPEGGVFTKIGALAEKDLTPFSGELMEVLSGMEEADVEELFADRYDFRVRPFLGEWVATGVELPYGKMTVTDAEGNEAACIPEFRMSVFYDGRIEQFNFDADSSAYYYVSDDDPTKAEASSYYLDDFMISVEEGVLTLETEDYIITYEPAEKFED